MYDSSSFANPTPLAHADTSRDVLPRGGTSQIISRMDHTKTKNMAKATDKYLENALRIATLSIETDIDLLAQQNNEFKDTGSIAYHHLSCYLDTLDLNTLSNLNIPYIFLELIENKCEFIFPRKTPKKISGKVPYRFVTIPSKKKTGFIRKSQMA
ncbi:hypothetical protein TNCV_4208381 [Trichonephila clavipes]|nr:hypothetical protein TNCV_4208381 [Trichonephila clavipes]